MDGGSRRRARFAGPGTFRCEKTGLWFEVEEAGTVAYKLIPWNKNLAQCENQDLMFAGSLFEVAAEPGFVHTVYLPHFICLREKDGSPADMPVPDFPDDMDDEPINIPQEAIQKVLETLQTPPSVTMKSTEQAAIAEDPPTTPIARPASSNTAEDSDVTGTSFERTVVGVQRELAKEVRVGMQNMPASLEGVRLCMMSSADQAAAMQALTSILRELQKTQKEISRAVIQLNTYNSNPVNACTNATLNPSGPTWLPTIVMWLLFSRTSRPSLQQYCP
ncbi:uncharacterized protein [Pleurodeles waltl]|uniref:uncharacterized protein n=1 Tax=Pleurodeles waltl TaxID=8319 RepID=UPI0037098A86